MNRLAIGVLMVVVALAGCGQQSGVDDLREFTENAHRNTTPNIDLLPALEPAAVFIYRPGDKIDPFSRSNLLIQDAEDGDVVSLGLNAPDRSRKKGPLEAYPIEEVALVGILNQDGVNWAIIRAPDETVHRVAKGGYVGVNDGQVIRVQDREVHVDELVQDDLGRWEKQPKQIVLVE